MSSICNLRYLKTIAPAQRLFSKPHTASYLDEMRRKIVLKSMYSHFPTEVVQEVKSQRRSNANDDALIEDFMKTEQPKIELKRDSHYKKALAVMTKLFRPKELYKPVAFPDLRYYPWRLNVSAEAPYNVQPKWKAYMAKKAHTEGLDSSTPTFHNLFDELFVINRKLVHQIKEGSSTFFEEDGTPKPYYWVNLHARAHVVGPDDEDKIRAVFGVPKLLLMVENMFLWPMQADLLNRDTSESPMFWGCEIMKGGWKRLRNLIHKKTESGFRTILSADWSQFDRRALFDIIDDVHNIWKTFYDWTGTYQPTNFYPNASTNPEKFENLWKWFTHNVKHYPIALPDGRLFQWTRNGVASGFQETQLLDSWINGIMLLTTLSEAGIDISHKHFFLKLQGDDSLAAFSESSYRIYGREKFLSLLARIALRRFNAKLSADKSNLHDRIDDVYVLGYYNKGGLAYRTDVDLLSHLLFPERSQTLEATAASALGIAVAAQGCSKPVYDTCRQVYDFITIELGKKAAFSREQEKKAIYLLGIDPEDLNLDMNFPSFLSTWMQNFILTSRDESARQRSWPTDPIRTGGFYFL
nr:RNA-dependent RNA polymerase [Sarcosphaera coronaria partitivirus]